MFVHKNNSAAQLETIENLQKDNKYLGTLLPGLNCKTIIVRLFYLPKVCAASGNVEEALLNE